MTIEQLKEFSIAELKSLAYDQITILQQTETNLRTLNQLIAEKSQPQQIEEPTVVDEDIK